MAKKNKTIRLTKKKIDYIIRHKRRGTKTNRRLAWELKISISTVKRVWTYWLKYKEPLEFKPFGRPKTQIPEEDERIVLQAFQTYKVGARRLESIIRADYKRHIPHNRIHVVLLKHGLAKPNRNKQKRRKPWVRFERDHSLTTVQMDWHESKINRKQVCVVLDDASRKILAGGEFDRATAENSIKLVKQVLGDYTYLKKPDQVLTDHGSQFTANKRDGKGNAEHAFEVFLEGEGIRHIMASVKHPQTLGKVEKWFDTYERHRGDFDSFKDFIGWYNEVRYHESLDNKHFLMTPDQAFWYKMQPGCLLKLLFSWG